MGRPLLWIVLFVAGSALCPAAGAAAVPRRSCAHSGETLKSDAHARALLIGTGVYGCLRSSGRLIRLGSETDIGSSSGGFRVRMWGFAGRFVALAEECTAGGGPFTTELRVVDLRSGRVKHRARIGQTSCGYISSDDGFARDVAITRGGSMIWIAVSGAQCCTQDLGVFKADGLGRTALDRGPGIAQELRLAGHHATWRRGDAAMSYDLHDQPSG